MSTIIQLTGDGAKWIALLTYSRDDEGTAISCCGWDSAAAVRAENLGYSRLNFDFIAASFATADLRPPVAPPDQLRLAKVGVCSS